MRNAAGRKNKRSRVDHPTAAQFQGGNLFSICVKFYSSRAGEHGYAAFFYIPNKRIPNRLRFICDREHAQLGLLFGLHTPRVKKVERFLHAPLRERREKKFPAVFEF